MFESALEDLKQCFEFLKKNNCTEVLKDKFEASVLQLNRNWKECFSRHEREISVQLITAVLSKTKKFYDELLEIFIKMSQTVANEQLTTLAVLILTSLQKSKFKNSILHKLESHPQVANGKKSTKLNVATSQSKSEGWVVSFMYQLAALQIFEHAWVDFKQLLDRVIHVNEPYVLTFMLNSTREYIFHCNNSMVRVDFDIEQMDYVSCLQNIIVKNLYKFEGPPADASKVDDRMIKILSQVALERIAFRIGFFVNFSEEIEEDALMEKFTSDLKWIKVLKQEDMFFRMVGPMLHSEKANSTDNFVMDIRKVQVCLHIAKILSVDLLPKFVGIGAIQIKRFIKTDRLIPKSVDCLKIYFTKLIELTHSSSLKDNTGIVFEILLSAYRTLQYVLEEDYNIVDIKFLDQIMLQNSKRMNLDIRLREVDLILWIVNKSLSDVSAVEAKEWPSFFQAICQYLKTFPSSTILGLQLSIMEFYLEIISSMTEDEIPYELNSLKNKLKGDVELTFVKQVNSSLQSKFRYLMFKLNSEYLVHKNSKVFNIEKGVAISNCLKQIENLLTGHSDNVLSHNHSIRLISDISKKPTAEFIDSFKTDIVFLRSMMNLIVTANLYHSYSLAALSCKCILLCLLSEDPNLGLVEAYSETRSSRSKLDEEKVDSKSNSDSPLRPVLLYVLTEYATSLFRIDDDNITAWLSYSVNLLNSCFKLSEDDSGNKDCFKKFGSYGKYLLYRSFQQLSAIVDCLGPSLCERYNIIIISREVKERELIEQISKNKSCINHFELFTNFIAKKLETEEDPYIRATCFKELANCISCFRDIAFGIGVEDNKSQEQLEYRGDIVSGLSGAIHNSKKTLSNLCLNLRRLLGTCFTASYNMGMYKSSLKIVKQYKKFAMFTGSCDDYVAYLSLKSEIKAVGNGKCKMIALLEHVGIDLNMWLDSNMSSKKLVESNSNQIKSAIDALHLSSGQNFVNLILNMLNDLLNKQNMPIAAPFASQLQRSMTSQEITGRADHISDASKKIAIEYALKHLGTCGSIVNVIYRGKDCQSMRLKQGIESFCSQYSALFSGKNHDTSLEQKAYLLEYTYLCLVRVLFSRMNTFNDAYEQMVVKISHLSFWKCSKLGLFAIARQYLELIMHFVYCHINQISPRNYRDSNTNPVFWLTPTELGSMAQVISNPSYDLRRQIKASSLQILKRRESYARASLKRLTMKRAANLKDFYKYSLFFNGKVTPKHNFKDKLQSYAKCGSSPVLIISAYKNILNSMDLRSALHFAFRYDGSQWVYTLLEDRFANSCIEVHRLLAQNEANLRVHSAPDENILSRDWWGMRMRTEKTMDSKLKEVEISLGLNAGLFDSSLEICKSLSSSTPVEEIKYNSLIQRLDEIILTSGGSTPLLKSLLLESTLANQSYAESNEDNFILKHSKSIAIRKKKPLFLLIDCPHFFVPFEHLSIVSEMKSNLYRVIHIAEAVELDHPEEPNIDLETVRTRVSDVELNTDIPKCYYLLNPGGDLKNTEARMRDFLEKKFSQWKGKIGCEPQASEIARYLKRSCNFLFIGHGSGESYFNHDYLNRLQNLKNIVILMGCCSAAMYSLSDFDKLKFIEYDGIVSDYISSQSNLVIGNLWSVTDKDADKLTFKLVEAIFEPSGQAKTNPDINLEVLRNECKLPRLNGSAVVKFARGTFVNNFH